MAEQPIDPDKVTSWCEICKIEVIGYSNWIRHLESVEHKDNQRKEESL